MNDKRNPADGDRRIIEDYLPIQVISAEAAREKSVRKGHISTLHLWWARRPLVAARAAVYGALVPAVRFVPPNGSEAKAKSLGRANAAKFIERLCKYPGTAATIAEAEEHILAAHADRLSAETGKPVTEQDIREGRAPRPKILDMFAGGGAIPLEGLRLGCESYALDLNPVAHIIELCTLVYPQKYGKPDSGAKGSAKDGTWSGLGAEVKRWGEWLLDRVREEIGDLYPLIPDPKRRGKPPQKQVDLWMRAKDEVPDGFLIPVAYLWTRTVRCKKASCVATVPLVKQTWLCNKRGRYVALKGTTLRKDKRVQYDVVESRSESGLGFDPRAGSEGGNATCPFCGTVADAAYVMEQGVQRQVSQQLMAIACVRPGARGKVYLSVADAKGFEPNDALIETRIDALCQRTRLSRPDEPISPLRPSPNARGLSGLTRHGIVTFGQLFTPRQSLCLLTFSHVVAEAERRMRDLGNDPERARAVSAMLALAVDKVASRLNSLTPFDTGRETVVLAFGRQALPDGVGLC